LIDLIVGGQEGREIEIYLNTGNRKFGEPVPLGSADRIPYSITIADLNRNGINDLVVGYQTGKGAIFYGDGSGRNFVETT
jgi:hypothetical protein